ncbi:Serine/threonine-protein kinase HT1 [Hordeum vulgare]|nr:Serine/threonine-protein kinase HT1 [Hordeum vulgare]
MAGLRSDVDSCVDGGGGRPCLGQRWRQARRLAGLGQRRAAAGLVRVAMTGYAAAVHQPASDQRRRQGLVDCSAASDQIYSGWFSRQWRSSPPSEGETLRSDRQIGGWRHYGVVPLLEASFLEQRWMTEEGVERLRLDRSFGGDVKSCLTDRCYDVSCLLGRCYARYIFLSLHVRMDERRTVAPFGDVVASTDGRTSKGDTDLSPEDGTVVR